MKRTTLLTLLLLVIRQAAAQDNIGIKFMGLSIHPKGEEANAFLMPRKFDKQGYLVLNLGAMVSYEKFILDDALSVKVVQALYSDCADRTGGFSHIGIRGKIFKTDKHSLYGGIGPTLIYRRNWIELPGYTNPNRFRGREGAAWQWLFLWYGGEIEYCYYLSEKVDLATTFVPGYPDLMSLSVGIKYKLN